MIKQSLLFLTLAAAASPALAQSDDADSKWSGAYIGASVGLSEPRGGDDARILFDTNLDGGFGDTVRSGAGADAFSPGFCGGIAASRTPAAGCVDDKGGATFGVRAGYDWQVGNFVFGALAEYNSYDVRDGLTGFSTTPASYTFVRDLDSSIALRARGGVAFGQNNDWLAYATAGAVRAKISNSFQSTNTANAFSLTEGGDSNGVQFGAGIERKIAGNVSIGLEYLRTRIDDEDARVLTSQGTAPLSNPFLLVNASGTNLRRSDDRFDLDTLQLTLNLRF